MPTRGPSEVLTEVINLTVGAGEVARRWFGQATGERKADGTLASEADVAAEEFLKQGLGRLFPGDEICSEESPQPRPVGRGRVWSLDPLDGTHNFIAGLGMWAVSVGLIEEGRAALGVVHSPPLGLTIAAARGEGAWRNGEPLAPPSAAPIERNDLVAVNSEMPLDFTSLPGKSRNLGSAALHGCLVATGVFRAALFYNWVLWDLAAGLCVAAETGLEARWAGGELLGDLSGLGAAERQGLLVLAPPGVCGSLADLLREPR
jgi:myo-inositol-1(or 4)-monophosphatase